MKRVNLELSNPSLDTLELSRTIFSSLKNHKLDTIAKHLDVSLENHHRALDDAQATKDILLKTLEILEEKGVYTFDQINNLRSGKDNTKDETFHLVLLVKNLVGLKNMYRLCQ